MSDDAGQYSHPPQFAGRYPGCVLDDAGNCSRWNHDHSPAEPSNAVEMAREAALAERRAEEAEFHVEQLRDACDRAERRIERTERLLEGWEHDGPDDPAMHLLIQRVREALGGVTK